jgi:hypothetical protein
MLHVVLGSTPDPDRRSFQRWLKPSSGPISDRQRYRWNKVLPFFLRFPAHSSRHWEEELLIQMSRQGTGFSQPNVDRVADQPSFALLGPRNGADSLARRRAGKLGDESKQYYQSFESNPKP